MESWGTTSLVTGGPGSPRRYVADDLGEMSCPTLDDEAILRP